MKALLSGAWGDERGAAFITALLILVMLTALGMAAIMTSTTETMLARNDYTAKQVHYAAEAGMQDAMAKLDFGAITPDLAHYDTWKYESYSTFRFYTYTSVNDHNGKAQAFMGYSVTVKYKIEGDYGDTFHRYSSLNGELVKYNKAFQYPSAAVYDHTQGQPVYIIRSLGIMYSGGRRSTAEIVVDCSENTLNVYPPGALYSSACINAHGSFIVDGGTMPSYVTACDTAGLTINSPPGIISGGLAQPGTYISMTGSNPRIGANASQLADLARSDGGYYKRTGPGPNAWDPLIDTNPVWGDKNNPKIVYLDEPGQEYTFNGQATGYGVLVVNGDLKVTGTMVWYGLIYVTGNLDASTGTITVKGGVMSGGDTKISDIGGNAEFFYNRTALDTIAQKMFKQKLISWRKLYQ